jgi:hypothetical protein
MEKGVGLPGPLAARMSRHFNKKSKTEIPQQKKKRYRGSYLSFSDKVQRFENNSERKIYKGAVGRTEVPFPDRLLVLVRIVYFLLFQKEKNRTTREPGTDFLQDFPKRHPFFCNPHPARKVEQVGKDKNENKQIVHR